MPQLAALKDELTDIMTMKDISSALTEASASKLKKIRDLFEKNKTFYDEIRHLYRLIRMNASHMERLKSHPSSRGISKIIRVAVSSNQRFYGNVNNEILYTFLADNDQKPSELMVIGTTGIDYMQHAAPEVTYNKFILSKDFPSTDEARTILASLLPYSSVIIYYPKFVSLVSQTVGKIDITQWENPNTEVPENERSILFEPEFEKVAAFFEGQVRTLLFLRVMLESDLARTAARLITMSTAEERAEELAREKGAEIRLARRSLINLQLMEMFASMGKWKRD